MNIIAFIFMLKWSHTQTCSKNIKIQQKKTNKTER